MRVVVGASAVMVLAFVLTQVNRQWLWDRGSSQAGYLVMFTVAVYWAVRLAIRHESRNRSSELDARSPRG